MPGIVHQSQVQMWQGQFPPPEAVKEYEAVLPGSFDRMIRMAERLQDSQIDETKRAQDYTAVDTKRGHWLGFSATVAAVFGAVIIAIVAAMTKEPGAYAVAALLVAVPVMAVAKALIESVKIQPLVEFPKVAPSVAPAAESGQPPAAPAADS